MIDVKEETHKELYYNVDKCLDFCKNIKPNVLKEHVEFHLYWKVGLPFERKQTLPIKSYLATQDLTNTSLNVWSNVDLNDNEFIKPFLPHINLKIWNPIEEAKGTVLENKLNILNADDSKNWAGGDLFRILCLHKYGGLYIDFDVVFLRDFSALLNQEFMYKWSFQQNMINGAVMRMFKNSQLTNDLLNEIIKTGSVPNSTVWSTVLYEKVRLYNKNWTIFPCGFFNTEWIVKLTNEEKQKNPELVKFITYPFKKTEYSKELYDGAFSWHWHNNWQEEVEIDSKWEILEKKMNNLLKEKI